MAKGEFYMMGGQFEKVDGNDVLLSEIAFNFDMANVPAYDKSGNYKKVAPQVQIAFANSEGNTPYYYISDAKKVGTEYVPGWVGASGKAADPTVGAGIGFWFKDGSSTTPAMTISGQVLPDSPWERTIPAVDYFMLVNPFPVSYTLSDATAVLFDEIDASAPAYDKNGNYKKVATQIQVPFADSEGFTTYYYISDAKKVGTSYVPGWVTASGKDAGTVTVPAGRGCWFKPAVANMKVTFYMQ